MNAQPLVVEYHRDPADPADKLRYCTFLALQIHNRVTSDDRKRLREVGTKEDELAALWPALTEDEQTRLADVESSLERIREREAITTEAI